MLLNTVEENPQVILSSETQGQIVGAKESLNGRKNKARRKVKNGEKSSSGRSLLFFCAIFFRLFRLSLAPTICPWVSEDGVYHDKLCNLHLIGEELLFKSKTEINCERWKTIFS